jgi:ATP-dependent DNA helicase RecG
MRRLISVSDARHLLAREEDYFWDDKSARCKSSGNGSALQKIACAFANSDGGEFAVGIEDRRATPNPRDELERWQGFASEEDGNFIHQELTLGVTPDVPYSMEWLEIARRRRIGLVALVTIKKSASLHRTAKGVVYVRRGAQNLRRDDPQDIVDLALSKGAQSYEGQYLDDYKADRLSREPELKAFLDAYSPHTPPDSFIESQGLAHDDGRVSVAGAVLYCSYPPKVLQKKCSVKIGRWKTQKDIDREYLEGIPETIEGPARVLIQRAIEATQRMLLSVEVLQPDGTFSPAGYPPEALEEIIANAVIHRDYNIDDDICIKIFDNRVEVHSPGTLPGHMTLDILLTSRCARNSDIIRLLNKYPEPVNRDIGEGIDTVFRKMAEAKLEVPTFAVEDNTFVVRLQHGRRRPSADLILEYLDAHSEITNHTARQLCGVSSDNTIKRIFSGLASAGMIEKVPGKGRGPRAAWRRSRVV